MRLATLLLILTLPLSALGAVEDFTTWTEVDAYSAISRTATTVTVTNLPAKSVSYVAQSGTYNQDSEYRMQFDPGAVSHDDQSCFLGVLSFSTHANDFAQLRTVDGGSCASLVYREGPSGLQFFWWLTGTGGTVWAVSEMDCYLTLGTTYYLTVTRDADGGANSTGVYVVYVCTGNYYNESGASLFDTETLTCPSGCPTSWSYLLTAHSRHSNLEANTASGTISNLDLDPSTQPSVPPDQATDPSPADEATDVSIDATLSWTAGDANDYDVYFGLAITDINELTQGNIDANTYDPGTLDYSTEYHWRIDANDPNGTTTGALWTFTTEAEPNAPAKASNPFPADGAGSVPVGTTLSWTGAGTYDVYFGIGTPALVSEDQAGLTYVPTLAPGLTYAWRIDSTDPNGTTTGDTWTFSTETDDDPEEPVTGWQRSSAWNRTPQWRKTPAWRKR